MSVYPDASFFVSLYLDDAHSDVALRRIKTAPPLWMTPLHRAEWTHAIAQHVFRGVFSQREALRFYSALEEDRQLGLWLEVDIPASAFETATGLAKKYVPRLGCRTLDTLHVASALELGAREFWSFDERQIKLARAVGLKS